MELLRQLYNIHAPSGKEAKMVDFLEEYLFELGVETHRDKYNNLYGVKGEADTYPCIVAHTDEVFTTRSEGFEVHQAGQMVFGIDSHSHTFVGLGADDKNGIWVALKAFQEFDIMKGAFFVQEEVGCIGSSKADMSFFEDARFVLQCDRNGFGDFINNASGTELHGTEFVTREDLFAFGYRPAKGIMTDVMQLKDNGLKVSAANISCGYYNAHTDDEYTVFSDLENCFELVSFIVNNYTEVYAHEATYSKYYGAHYKTNGTYYYDDYQYDTSSWDNYEPALAIAQHSADIGNVAAVVERDIYTNYPKMDKEVVYFIMMEIFGEADYPDYDEFDANTSDTYAKIISNMDFAKMEAEEREAEAI